MILLFCLNPRGGLNDLLRMCPRQAAEQGPNGRLLEDKFFCSWVESAGSCERYQLVLTDEAGDVVRIEDWQRPVSEREYKALSGYTQISNGRGLVLALTNVREKEHLESKKELPQ